MPNEARKPVVAGVDGSPASTAAVQMAAAAAALRGTRLVVVHAVPRRHDGDQADPPLATALAQVRSTRPELPVDLELLPGEPAGVLARRSRDACLIVVGHRGRCGYTGLHVGSVAMRVICLAEVPVLVYRPLDGAATEPRPVLAGVEAATADSVLRFAFLEAALRGTPLLVVRLPGAVPAAPGCDAGLADVLTRWSGKYPQVRVRWVARRSVDAAVVLAAASKSAQLVVVGLAGAGSAIRLLNGSVSRALVHRAGCPVAVVPTD